MALIMPAFSALQALALLAMPLPSLGPAMLIAALTFVLAGLFTAR
jgi:hypothetical protein